MTAKVHVESFLTPLPLFHSGWLAVDKITEQFMTARVQLLREELERASILRRKERERVSPVSGTQAVMHGGGNWSENESPFSRVRFLSLATGVRWGSTSGIDIQFSVLFLIEL